MAGYTLRLSEHELNRYRRMAELAWNAEGAARAAAGIGPGARVVDIGCGPGLPLLLLAEAVGADGRVVGVDQSDEAIETAKALSADRANIEIRHGQAVDTGLAPGEWDVVHMRHVLLHNGPRIADILRHAFDLLRPGGRLYVNETWAGTHIAEYGLPPEIEERDERYWSFIESLGNDLAVGPHLGRYAAEAGFEVVHRQARFDAFPLTPDIHPPSFAGRDAMLAAGACDHDDIVRWERALRERRTQGVVYVSQFTVVGAKP